jgi:hypothetical protein
MQQAGKIKLTWEKKQKARIRKLLSLLGKAEGWKN